MDQEEKPSIRRPRKMRDIPRSQSRISDSFARDELNSERIGNVSHIRSMRQKSIDENSNVPEPTKACPVVKIENDVFANDKSETRTEFANAEPIKKLDTQDLSSNLERPSFLAPKGPAKQWRSVSPVFGPKSQPNKSVISNGRSTITSSQNEPKTFKTSSVKLQLSANPRLSDPYLEHPAPPANQNAAWNGGASQNSWTGHPTQAAGISDVPRGGPVAPFQSDLLRADDDIPAGVPHQSRTFRMLQDMVGEEGNNTTIM